MRIPQRRGRAAALVAVSTAVALTLAGCGSSSDSSSSSAARVTPPPSSGEPVELRFAWWGSDSRHKTTQKVIDAYEAEHPNVTINGEFGEFSGYWDKLATATAAKDAPDIIQMDEKYLRDYAGRGALLDLTTQSDVLSTADFDENALKSGEFDGGLYGLTHRRQRLQHPGQPGDVQGGRRRDARRHHLDLGRLQGTSAWQITEGSPGGHLRLPVVRQRGGRALPVGPPARRVAVHRGRTARLHPGDPDVLVDGHQGPHRRRRRRRRRRSPPRRRLRGRPVRRWRPTRSPWACGGRTRCRPWRPRPASRWSCCGSRA